METIKCLIVGDGNVGKTSLLVMYTTETFNEEYVPTILDNYTTDLTYKERPYRMEIWDTAGQEEYARLRVLSYQHADVFFICYAINNPTSLENAVTLWCSEIRHHCPRAIYLLVGTKLDLRNDEATIEKLKKEGKSPVTKLEGFRCAQKIKAQAYLECSALTGEGLKDVFTCGVLEFFERKERPRRRRFCSIL